MLLHHRLPAISHFALSVAKWLLWWQHWQPLFSWLSAATHWRSVMAAIRLSVKAKIPTYQTQGKWHNLLWTHSVHVHQCQGPGIDWQGSLAQLNRSEPALFMQRQVAFLLWHRSVRHSSHGYFLALFMVCVSLWTLWSPDRKLFVFDTLQTTECLQLR